MSLDIRESSTLRRRLCDWVVCRREEVCALIPHDYTIYDAHTRSSNTHEFLQHLYTLAQMRRSFFMRESPIWHCMEIVIEWTKQTMFVSVGMQSRCRWVFKKHCAGQERREKEERERKRKRERENKIRNMQRKQQQQKRRKEIRREEKEEKQRRAIVQRIARAASKFEHSKRLWSDKDRHALMDRIMAATMDKKYKMFDIIDYYGCDVDPLEWTTQTCRHVSKIIGRPAAEKAHEVHEVQQLLIQVLLISR